jgi:hypothetical protein
MTDDEINTIIALAKTARSKKAPVWKYLAMTIGPFNFKLLEPKKGDTSVLATDKGPVILPKLYRRYTSWSVRHKAKVTSENFQQFRAAGSGGKHDACFETADFLANGAYSASPRTLDQFVVGGKTIKFQPDGLVFQEAPPSWSEPTASRSAIFDGAVQSLIGECQAPRPCAGANGLDAS